MELGASLSTIQSNIFRLLCCYDWIVPIFRTQADGHRLMDTGWWTQA